ncbi:MAG: aminotransferase class I/II-fold pyridoxal phosphate-dependent enzyme [Saprospiraceae bacterium]
MPTSLSNRGLELIGKPLRADFESFAQALEDPFDAEANPEGAITLCIAENVLSWPEMRAKLQQIAQQEIPQWVSKYTSVLGAPPFQEALARFAERHIISLGGTEARTLSSDHFAISSGATGIVELTALLLCDDNDVAAFPAPCYPVYTQDVGNKANVERYDIQPASAWDKTPGQHPLTVHDLDRSLAEIKAQGKNLKLLVLTQPDNPTGAIYSQQQLMVFAAWSIENEVHLCVNELYALSQVDYMDARLADDYGPSSTNFYSFLHEVEKRKSPFLYWWYSFSKDFGISGLRTGVMYTRNDDLLEAFGNYGAPSTVSNHTQWMLSELLNDDAWVTAFAKTNQKRLTEGYIQVIETLRERGITYSPARGSLFVWARLNEEGSTSDEAFWRKLYDDQKVLLTAPGGFGHDQGGWMRLVYSCVDATALGAALGRM